MKVEQRHLRRVKSMANLFTNPAAYIILLPLAYALGYLSASHFVYERPVITVSPSPPLPPSAEVTTTPIATTRRISSLKTTAVLRSQLDNFKITTHCGSPLPPKLVRQTVLDRVFKGTSPYANFPPAYVRTLLRTKRVKGWGSYNAVFKDLIQTVKPRTIIEVGTFLGASALNMAELTRQLGLQTQILCIDDFRGWPEFRLAFRDIGMVNGDVLLMYQFMQNVIHFNATGSILPVPFSTGSALEALCEWGVTGDLIEIDAGHDFHSAWADINRAYRILRPGGVIFGDDYFATKDNKGVSRAVNLFAQIHGLKVRAHGRHWVIDSTNLS